MKFYFMRHGLSDATQVSAPIDERNRGLVQPAGVDEVTAVAKELYSRGEIPSVIFCSDLGRAVETADIVGTLLGIKVYYMDEMNPQVPLYPFVVDLLDDLTKKRVMLVGHSDNIIPLFRRCFGKNVTVSTAQCFKTSIDRDDPSLNKMLWSLAPSDLGYPDLDPVS